MIIVTGGAGFIGSVLVAELNRLGRRDIVIVDSVYDEEQEHNLGVLSYEELLDGDTFRQKLREGDYDGGDVEGLLHLGALLSTEKRVGEQQFQQDLQEGFYDGKGVEAILHLGAISSTVEEDWEKLEDTNVAFSQEVIRWCADNNVRCIYASSGATYGDGSKGYSDDHVRFDELASMNLYGKSKLDTDIWARDAGYLDTVVGVRYFNVFGPNEWHKGNMRSVVAKKFETIRDEGYIELFKSNSDEYEDGGQMRDFIYVKDAVRMTLWFLSVPEVAGVFNIGTGKARSWNDLARAMFAALDMKEDIRYVDMPDNLKNQYQNFTQADMSKMKAVGWAGETMTLEESVKDYVQEHLMPHRHVGEEETD